MHNKMLNKAENVNKLYKSDFNVYHTNIQSVNGRLASLQSIVNMLQVDICTVNKTNLKGKKIPFGWIYKFLQKQKRRAHGWSRNCTK